MRTVYDVYHWPHPDACAEIRGEHPTVALAAYTTGHPDSPAWEPTPNADGWILNPAQTGGKRVWGIFARKVPETDAERIELSLDLISNVGQTDGDHHKAWVIDQVVRLLAEDYPAWIAEYEDGEDGPETYSWDKGIAP